MDYTNDKQKLILYFKFFRPAGERLFQFFAERQIQCGKRGAAAENGGEYAVFKVLSKIYSRRGGEVYIGGVAYYKRKLQVLAATNSEAR